MRRGAATEMKTIQNVLKSFLGSIRNKNDKDHSAHFALPDKFGTKQKQQQN